MLKRESVELCTADSGLLLLLQTKLMFIDKRRGLIVYFNTLELWRPHSKPRPDC